MAMVKWKIYIFVYRGNFTLNFKHTKFKQFTFQINSWILLFNVLYEMKSFSSQSMEVKLKLWSIQHGSIFLIMTTLDLPSSITRIEFAYWLIFELNWTYLIVYMYINTNGLDTSAYNLTILCMLIFNRMHIQTFGVKCTGMHRVG